MEIIRSLGSLKPLSGSVVTLGSYDGIHRGHREILSSVVNHARARSLPSVLITFDPHPRHVLEKNKMILPMLMSLEKKLEIIKEIGLQYIHIIEFTDEFSNTTAGEFLDNTVIPFFNPKYIIVGYDHHFGKDREGDFNLLKKFGDKHNFIVENLATIRDELGRISSTRIRKELALGNFQFAADCLGRPYSISGKVEHGYKNGRAIGFPTLNIKLARIRSPLLGVFAVFVDGLEDRSISGVASIGNRPILNNDDRVILEVHLFDFHEDVYGKNVSVRFIKKLRDQKTYDSFDVLQKQIIIDAKEALAACDKYLESANEK